MRSRYRYDKKTRGMVRVWDHGPRETRFHIIGDKTEPFQSQADGKIYDSKSRYRAEMKARGFVELGNDQLEVAPPEMPDVTADVVEAMKKIGEIG